MRSRWTVFQIFLCPQLFAFKRFCMKTRLSSILKTTNATKFIKTILERTYKVVLGTYNCASPMRPRLFVRGRWVLCNFWHLDCYNFCYILEKTAKLYLLEASHMSLKTRHKIIFVVPRITEKLPFKKLKMLFFLAPFISKIGTTHIFNFLPVKYFDKGWFLLKIWHKSQLLLKLRAV